MRRLDLTQGLSGLVGRKVRDLNDHSVGKLEDVLLDLSRGEILAVVISAGGSQVIPIPPATFRAVSKEKILVNADQKLFQAAPRLSQASSNREKDLVWFFRGAASARLCTSPVHRTARVQNVPVVPSTARSRAAAPRKNHTRS